MTLNYVRKKMLSGQEQKTLTDEAVSIVRTTIAGLRNNDQRIFVAGIMRDESTKIANAIMDGKK